MRRGATQTTLTIISVHTVYCVHIVLLGLADWLLGRRRPLGGDRGLRKRKKERRKKKRKKNEMARGTGKHNAEVKKWVGHMHV